jgi:signal transduction histidine kinase
VRATLLLLAVMLLASLLIAAFTLRLLSAQGAALEAAVSESDGRALALLANRIDHDLLSSMRPPFQILKNVASGDSLNERMRLAGESSALVQRILLLDEALHPRAHWAQNPARDAAGIDQWLSHRVAAETSDVEPYALHTFVERLPTGPVILALESVSEPRRAEGWILVVFDLPGLVQQVADPMLAEFNAAHGGRVQLQDADAPWDQEALHEPLNRALPGWLLSYSPDPGARQDALQHSRRLLLGVGGVAVLTLLLATFAAWRELQRERALAELRNRFVANLSHELKTPLSLIRLHAESLALHRIKDPSRQQVYLETILREADHLTDMIDSVLKLDQLRRTRDLLQPTARDLGDTVTRALDRYGETLAQRGARITVDVASELPPVAHDAKAVTHIILNLLNNALEHGERDIDVSLTRGVDGVDLMVTDSGVGLGPTELTAIRRAIAQGEAAPSRRGSGLGLALVERIAAAHRAYLLLDTPEQGGGLRVVVSFPIHDPEART